MIDLPQKTVLIIGVGGAGSEASKLCAALGMRVLGIDPRITDRPAGMADLATPDQIEDRLGQADFVILTTPETPETVGMFNTTLFTHIDIGVGLRAAHAIESGWVQVNQSGGQTPGHSYGGYKQSGIGREFSLEGMLDSFTQRKNVTVNLNTPRRQ